MDAWMGKILRVNLTRSEVVVEDLDGDLARKFIGGRGLASKMLYDEIDPKVDPVSPENKLIFATGPLTGAGPIAACRYMVVTKGYLTGAIACSNSGGHFGPELKFAGYDIIIFEGKAKEPVYLLIEDDRVEIRPAGFLWGKPIGETVAAIRKVLKEDLGKTEWEAKEFRVACIGPGGENLVRVSSVITDDGRHAARSGVGAVMGSKNLKAVVVKGSKSITLHDSKRFREILPAIWKTTRTGKTTGTTFPTYGTPAGVSYFNTLGTLPTHNFQSGVFDGAEKISGQVMKDTIVLRDYGCFSCPIRCGKVTEVREEGAVWKGMGPEYETIALMGSSCGIDDLAAIAKAGYICDESGIDTISVGGTIACAMELFEKGYLPEEDIGFKLNFGNAEALLRLVEMIGKKEGFGAVLAEGGYRLARKYGHPEFFMGVKKQEFPGYEPRGVKGMGLAMATSNRGACHLRGSTYWSELMGVPTPTDPLTAEGKPLLVKDFQNFASVVDSSGMCIFAFRGIWQAEMVLMLNSVTGLNFTHEEMLKTGERIWNLERLFNLKAGFTKEDDNLPPRMLEEPAPRGPAKGHVVPLAGMLEEYYRLRGWDASGVPTDEKRRELEL
ncbi:MAG: aldehyde ferredoxin oxidoreductase family protein [Desulfobacterales bacterium]|nr:aldehyde ferredoxin oxidoreductase family protein [Desulfobacterales bacterium]